VRVSELRNLVERWKSPYFKYIIYNTTHTKRSRFSIILCFNNIICMNKDLAHLYILHFMRPSGFDTCKTFTAIPVEDNCGGCADVRPKTLILCILLNGERA